MTLLGCEDKAKGMKFISLFSGIGGFDLDYLNAMLPCPYPWPFELWIP